MATSPTYIGTPKLGLAQIANADASAKKSVVSAGASGSKVLGLLAASTDTSARIIQIVLTRSSVDYIIGAVSVPAGSGTDGTNPQINLFNTTSCPGLPVDNDGQPYLLMVSGDTLSVLSTTTVTTAKLVNVAAVLGDV